MYIRGSSAISRQAEQLTGWLSVLHQYLPQRASSRPSLQSVTPSHIHLRGMHLSVSHRSSSSGQSVKWAHNAVEYEPTGEYWYVQLKKYCSPAQNLTNLKTSRVSGD